LPSRTLLAVLNVTLHSWPIARPQISGRGSIPSFRGSFPRNLVGGRPFELNRRDSLGCGRKPALRSGQRRMETPWSGIPLNSIAETVWLAGAICGFLLLFPEKCADVVGQQLRFFHRREMSPLRHRRPSLDVEYTLGPMPRRTHQL